MLREPPGTRTLIALGTFPIAVLVLLNAYVLSIDEFWLALTAGLLVLAALAALIRGFGLYRERAQPVDLTIGVASAVLLYGVFWVGDQLLRAFGPSAVEEIRAIYLLADQLPTLTVAAVLIFVIAPGEELYWRGLVQWAAARRWGLEAGVLLAVALYATAHIVTGSLVIVLGALVAGLVWSVIYAIRGRLLGVIVSHVLFDLLVFVLLPLG